VVDPVGIEKKRGLQFFFCFHAWCAGKYNFSSFLGVSDFPLRRIRGGWEEDVPTYLPTITSRQLI
jgi:hypothetical protein